MERGSGRITGVKKQKRTVTGVKHLILICNRPKFLSARALWTCVVLSLLATAGCQLGDNRIKGAIRSSGPGVTLDVQISAALNDEVQMSWTAQTNVSGYNVYYASGSATAPECGQGTLAAGSPFSSNSATIGGLSAKVEYAFAVCPVGMDVRGNQSVTTLPALNNNIVYVGNSNWNDFVRNNGSDLYDADNTPCDGTESGDYLSALCIHGAEIRKFTSSDLGSSCSGYTIEDSANAFNWICDESTSPVTLYTSGLKEGKGLRDLVTASGFRPLRVIVTQNQVPVFSSSLETWWTNTVTALPTGNADLDQASTVYVLETSRADTGHAITADKVAVVTLDQAQLSAGATNILSGNNRAFLWIEGDYGSSDDTALNFDSIKLSNLRNVTVTNITTNHGIQVTNSASIFAKGIVVDTVADRGLFFTPEYSVAEDITISNTAYGLYVSDFFWGTADYSRFHNIKSYNASLAHISISGGDGTQFSNVDLSYGAGSGIDITSSSIPPISFNDLKIQNVGNHCMYYLGAYMTITNAIVANCLDFYFGAGAFGFVGINLVIANTSVSNIRMHQGYQNSMVNVILPNSGGIELFHTNHNNTRLGQIAFDGQYYIFAGARDVTFFDNLLLGSGASCLWGTGGAAPGVNAGLADATCANSGTSTANHVSVGPLMDSFIGMNVDDSHYPQATSGQLARDNITAAPEFDSWYRTWGDSVNSGPCTTGETCAIFDWSLKASDLVLRNTTNNGSSQNAAFVAGAPCPPAVDGNRTFTDPATRTFLINATEIIDDSLGNDNGLCETNEACIYSPNYGVYQGHGDYLSNGTCTFQDGTVTGVQMYAYPINGI